jgi:hypothetical protein
MILATIKRRHIHHGICQQFNPKMAPTKVLQACTPSVELYYSYHLCCSHLGWCTSAACAWSQQTPDSKCTHSVLLFPCTKCKPSRAASKFGILLRWRHCPRRFSCPWGHSSWHTTL